MSVYDVNRTNLVNFFDRNKEFYFIDYEDQENIAEMLFDTRRPPGFDENDDVYIGAPARHEAIYEDREDGQPILSKGGLAEDYPWQIAKRMKATEEDVPKAVLEAIDAGADNESITNYGKKINADFARTKSRIIEQHCADMLNNGMLTAGHASFNNSRPTSLDPYPQVTYDNFPWFDTAHPESLQVTGTTFSNHNASLSPTNANIQAVYQIMADTNAYDRDGNRIRTVPNLLMGQPATCWTIRENMGGIAMKDADRTPNVLHEDVDWMFMPWRYINDSSVWYMFEFVPGIGIKALKLIVNWKTDEFDLYYQNNRKTWVYQHEFSYGATTVEFRDGYCANKSAA